MARTRGQDYGGQLRRKLISGAKSLSRMRNPGRKKQLKGRKKRKRKATMRSLRWMAVKVKVRAKEK